MKHARKPIALILVLLLFLSLLPVGAFAADDAELTEEEEVVEVLPPEEETEAPAEEEEGIPEEEVLPPEDGEEEDVLPEETDDLEPMAEPEEEEDAEIEVQADPVYDEETGLYFTIAKEKATVTSYNSSVLPADLVIPETLGGYPVTAIGEQAFYLCKKLTSITIPEGVTAIGDAAFAGCDKMTSVSLPGSLREIGSGAFRWCYALTGIVIPEGVTTLGTEAFSFCKALTSVSLPGSLRVISEYAFNQCEKLTAVAMPEGVREIGRCAFYYCGQLQTVSLSKSLRTVGENAFADCYSLKNLTISEGLEEIGRYAFFRCGQLETVSFPNSLRAIGEYAFYNCYKMTELTIPEGVKTIGSSAFAACGTLTAVTLPGSLTVIGESAFRECSELAEITIPEGVKEIGADAFRSCTKLSTVSLPDTLQVIGENAFQYCRTLSAVVIPAGVQTIGNDAFYGCGSLSEIAVDAKNKNYCDVDGVLFTRDMNTLVIFPQARSGDYTVPDGVKTIAQNAFYNCSGLTGITFPDSLIEIGSNAFYNCKALKTIAFPDCVTALGSGAFSNCTALESVRLPSGIRAVQYDTFSWCSALTEVVIPDGVYGIENYAFYRCGNLQTVSLPNSVSYIGYSAFSDCSSLAAGTVYYAGTEEEAGEIDNYGGNDALFNAEWICDPEGGIAPVVILDREYIALKAGGEEAILTVTTPAEIPDGADLTWTVDDEEIVSIFGVGTNEEGFAEAWILTGDKAGTAWVTVALTSTAGSIRARCRIDVTADEVLPTVESVTLTEKKVSVEVFRTDYTRIAVIPNLSQNVFTAGLLEDYEVPEVDPGEYAVVKAEFVNPGAAAYFKLQVVDDRTLEVIPTEAALRAADAKDKALKGSYKTAIRVWIGGEADGNAFTTGSMTLTVKKSLPAIKAKAVKLNSFINDVQPVVFTGGTVTKITAVEGMPASGWLTRDQDDEPGELTLLYTGAILTAAPKSQKATLKLTVQAEGWAVDRVVPVTVTAAPVLPKVKYSSKTVTLNPLEGVCAVSVSVSPAEYLMRPETSATIRDSYIMENGQKLPLDNNVLRVMTEPPADDANVNLLLIFTVGEEFGSTEKARTFKFCMNIGGKEFPLTIKTLPLSKAPAISVKAKGTIDTGIPNSPVTLEITRKNTGTVAPEVYDIFPGTQYLVEILRGGETEPVNTLTRYGDVSSKLARITLTQSDLETSQKPLDPSRSYRARVSLRYGEAETDVATAMVIIPVKSTDPGKVKLSVSAKVTGKLDVLRPDSEILVTPTVKNAYGLTLYNDIYPELICVDSAGKASPANEFFNMEPNEAGTALRIRIYPTAALNIKAYRYYLHFHVNDGTGRYVRSKAIRLPLTMGKVKVTQSTKTLTMLKKDRNSSSAVFSLSTTDPTLMISGVTIANDKHGLYKLTALGGGRYAVSCTDKMTAKTAKNTTLKLAVTVVGNITGTPNATVSMKVTWK